MSNVQADLSLHCLYTTECPFLRPFSPSAGPLTQLFCPSFVVILLPTDNLKFLTLHTFRCKKMQRKVFENKNVYQVKTMWYSFIVHQ